MKCLQSVLKKKKKRKQKLQVNWWMLMLSKRKQRKEGRKVKPQVKRNKSLYGKKKKMKKSQDTYQREGLIMIPI